MNRAIGLFFAINTLFINVLIANNYHWKPVHPAFDSIAATLEGLEPEDSNVSTRLNELKEIAKTQNNPILRSRWHYWNAYFNGSQKNTTENKELQRGYIDEILLTVDILNYDYDYARLVFLNLNTKGDPSGNYLEQYQKINEILPIFQKYNDIRYEGNCYKFLGILFSELYEYKTSLDYFKKSDELYRQIGSEHALVSNRSNEAIVYYYMGEADTAKNTLRSLLKEHGNQKDTDLLMSLYNNLSLMTEDPQERAFCQQNTISIAQNASGSRQNYYKALVSNNLALRYAQNEKMLDSAILLYDFAYQMAQQEEASRIMLHALSGLSGCYAQKGDYEKAYSYLSLLQSLQDSVMGASKVREINRKEAKKAIDEYQNRIQLQEQKIMLQKRLSWGSLLILLLCACIFVVFVFYLRQKRRIDKITLRNKDLENKKLQQEVDYQNRELSSNMLILSEKKRFLQQILMQLEKFRGQKGISSACELTLRKMITEHMRSEDNWETFKMHFEKVHPNFFGKLKAQYPELSPNDLKLCAYIKIGLTIKEIAQMTAVLPATVKTNRYLLRKKFHLRDDQPLDAFIFNV